MKALLSTEKRVSTSLFGTVGSCTCGFADIPPELPCEVHGMEQSARRAYEPAKYRRVPLSVLTTPADGKIVYTNRWWAVTADDEALFFVGHNRRLNSPQCNHNQTVVERLCPEGCHAVHVPVAYLSHDCNDYV